MADQALELLGAGVRVTVHPFNAEEAERDVRRLRKLVNECGNEPHTPEYYDALDGPLDNLDALLAAYKEAETKGQAYKERCDRAERELDFTHDRGDHLIYRREWEEFERWQRGAGKDALNRLVAAESDLQAAKEALAYLFATYLPEAECNGPRDCAGTSRGCAHCNPDPNLEAARVLARLSTGTPKEDCDGSSECAAGTHMHGCYSDDGTNCDNRFAHRNQRSPEELAATVRAFAYVDITEPVPGVEADDADEAGT